MNAFALMAIEDLVLAGVMIWLQWSGHPRMAMWAFVILLVNVLGWTTERYSHNAKALANR